MAKYVNASACPLILPNDRLKTIAIGDEVEVDDKTAEVPAVAEMIKDGWLVKPKGKAAKSAD